MNCKKIIASAGLLLILSPSFAGKEKEKSKKTAPIITSKEKEKKRRNSLSRTHKKSSPPKKRVNSQRVLQKQESSPINRLKNDRKSLLKSSKSPKKGKKSLEDFGRKDSGPIPSPRILFSQKVKEKVKTRSKKVQKVKTELSLLEEEFEKKRKLKQKELEYEEAKMHADQLRDYIYNKDYEAFQKLAENSEAALKSYNSKLFIKASNQLPKACSIIAKYSSESLSQTCFESGHSESLLYATNLTGKLPIKESIPNTILNMKRSDHRLFKTTVLLTSGFKSSLFQINGKHLIIPLLEKNDFLTADLLFTYLKPKEKDSLIADENNKGILEQEAARGGLYKVLKWLFAKKNITPKDPETIQIIIRKKQQYNEEHFMHKNLEKCEQLVLATLKDVEKEKNKLSK